MTERPIIMSGPMVRAILTPAELELLTGKTERGQKRYGSQARVLAALGVPYGKRPDGTLVVCRHHVEAQRPTPHQGEHAPAVCL